jgi:hypothetical protein
MSLEMRAQCYARGADGEGNVALTVLYTDEWRVADVDRYRF